MRQRRATQEMFGSFFGKHTIDTIANPFEPAGNGQIILEFAQLGANRGQIVELHQDGAVKIESAAPPTNAPAPTNSPVNK